MTDEPPHQLYPLFFYNPNRPQDGETVAPLHLLRRFNETRAKKGLPPVTGRLFQGVLGSVPDAR